MPAEVQTPAATDISMSDLRTMMDGGTPATPAAEPAKPAETKPAEADPATDPATRTAPASEPEKKQEPDRDEQGRYTPNAEKRIAQLTAKQREAERKLEEAERKLEELQRGGKSPETPAAKPAADGRPRLADFENDPKYAGSYTEAYEAYSDALTDWKLSQRDRAAAEKAQKEADAARAQVWVERTGAAKEKHPDYDQVIDASPDVAFEDEVSQTILESELGPQILYALAKDPAEAERIAKLPTRDAIKAIGRLEDKLTAQSKAPETTKQPKVTNAPKPPATVAAGAAPHTPDPKDLDKVGMKEFKAQYDALLKR